MTRLNEVFIELMSKLSAIMVKRGEPFRSRAYQKAEETIMNFTGDIICSNDLAGKPGIGNTIMEKLNEYIRTGTLQILEEEKNNPLTILTDIYGVGPKKAKELVDNGITSIPKLRENLHLLNDVQKVGLYYYEDILQKIPRSEIEEYHLSFKKCFENFAGKMEIVGSYRRGAETSGDIDVIITSNTQSIFTNFIDNLVEAKIILHILSRGPTKCLVVAKLPSARFARRVDFLFTNPEEFPFAILYFTGSKIFNTVMRNIALTNGYTMNEHGIYKMEGKIKGEKANHVFQTEKDIFDFLGLVYKNPFERIDGRAIVLKDTVKDVIENDLEIIKQFQKNGISVLEKVNRNELISILKKASDAYYNKDPILTDNQFDIIKEFITKKYPNEQVLKDIGAPVQSNKVKLPYFMGSMDKIKPDTNALTKWQEKFKGPYVISCKLDGVSGLYTTENDVCKLYTRGDGKFGQDISHLIPYLKLPKIKGLAIRGEIIMLKSVFEEKYARQFANPRNIIAGILKNKTIHPATYDLQFVAYEVIQPILEPIKQMQLLKSMEILTVDYSLFDTITNNSLSNLLLNGRNHSPYEIDGIIVTNNEVYERTIGNPEHAFAFKMILTDQIAEAKVVDVIWTASKDGYLKPRVQIEPIQLGGVCITFATGFNGSFIYNNKIGIGSTIDLIRSGDVIPHIRKVVIPAPEAKMPDVAYEWTDTGVDIMLQNVENDPIVKEKNIAGFFKEIGVESLGSGNIKRIIDAGYESIAKIIQMSREDFLKIDGFKEKMAVKLHSGIREKLETANIITIMNASNIFGRGFSTIKLELIMNAYPDVLLSKETSVRKIEKIASIKGMAIKTAELFVEKIPAFIKFMREIGVPILETKVETNTSHPLFGKTIVVTGFRDKDFQEKMKTVGVNIGTSVSKQTMCLIVKNLTEDTTKANEARKLGVPIIVLDEFIKKYFV
jgi:NAD-dependent DNA ligase/DNA polymerase/3'-5' exonuclease PolX